MESINQFTLEPLPKREDNRRLVSNGQPTHIVVNGDTISAQFSHHEFIALITQYDFFEGANHWIYLLDRRPRIIDQVSLPQSFGFVEKVRVLADAVSFGLFDSDDRWTMSIDPAGRRSLALSDLVRRPNRFMFSRRHIVLHRDKAAS